MKNSCQPVMLVTYFLLEEVLESLKLYILHHNGLLRGLWSKQQGVKLGAGHGECCAVSVHQLRTLKHSGGNDVCPYQSVTTYYFITISEK